MHPTRTPKARRERKGVGQSSRLNCTARHDGLRYPSIFTVFLHAAFQFHFGFLDSLTALPDYLAAIGVAEDLLPHQPPLRFRRDGPLAFAQQLQAFAWVASIAQGQKLL